MNENSITRFEVSNFKKFDHLVVENIGQVNLITGDNNVGKTTLLEALLCNEDNLRWISNLHRTLCFRKIEIHLDGINTKKPKFPNENYLNYIIKELNLPLVCKFVLTSGEEKELGIEYRAIENLGENLYVYRRDKYDIANVRDWVIFYKSKNPDELQWLYFDDMENGLPFYWPYITFNKTYSDDLPEFLSNIDKKTSSLDYLDKQKIKKYLKLGPEHILDYELRKFGEASLIGIATETDTNYRAITQFGDGFQKFFRYIVEILYAQKRYEPRLMIDEIDTGVHFSKMKDEWKAIFELSKQTGIQIFATTHSMDCIKAFVEAGNEDVATKSGLRLIEIEALKGEEGTNKHIATTFTHSQLQASLNSELNVRGGEVW